MQLQYSDAAVTAECEVPDIGMPSDSSTRSGGLEKRVAAAQQEGGGHIGDGGLAAPQPAVIQSAKAAKLEGEILADCERVRQWGISKGLKSFLLEAHVTGTVCSRNYRRPSQWVWNR